MQLDTRDPLERDRARQRRARQIYRRRLVLAAFLLALIILIVVLVIAFSGGSNEGAVTSTTKPGTTSTSLIAASYSAVLTGGESVPPVDTQSTGALTLTYDPKEDALTYSLEVNGLTDTTSAAIYEGASGSNGTAVYTLFAGPMVQGQKHGELATGTIVAADLTGTLAGTTIGDLIALIKGGNAYASVGNRTHPVDAIRGQIR